MQLLHDVSDTECLTMFLPVRHIQRHGITMKRTGSDKFLERFRGAICYLSLGIQAEICIINGVRQGLPWGCPVV